MRLNKTGTHYRPFAGRLPAKGIKGADKSWFGCSFAIKPLNGKRLAKIKWQTFNAAPHKGFAI
ncbi:hypothetical protein FT670_11195 [Aeromonas jandaei]|nr:hypothetical protein FT670_11195 [Aeromonas jandaei]